MAPKTRDLVSIFQYKIQIQIIILVFEIAHNDRRDTNTYKILHNIKLDSITPAAIYNS